MGTTSIQWTDATWNPVRGCSRVSPGCDHCYAMGQAHRFSGAGKPYDGLTMLRRGKVDWSGVARFVPEMLDAPLRWKKPRRIFVNSMSDLFHHSVTNEQIAAVFGVMAACPQHTFQALTKRAERMREWFEWVNADYLEGPGALVNRHARAAVQKPDLFVALDEEHARLAWPIPNVHLGVSCEDQQRADERIPHLLETPAAVRFVSCEPLLGPIVFDHRHLGQDSDCPECGRHVGVDEDGCCSGCGENALYHGIDWCIVGGESGPGARPCDVGWIESVIEQCKAAGVPVFCKQLGSKPRMRIDYPDLDGSPAHVVDALPLADRKGGDPAEWPDELRVREFPEVQP